MIQYSEHEWEEHWEDVTAADYYPPFIHGERNMLCSIVETSLRDLVNDGREFREAAIDWFMDDDTTENDAFSFRWICQELDWEFNITRKQIENIIIETENGQDSLGRGLPTGVSYNIS